MKIKKRNYLELFAFVAFVAIGFFLHFCNFDNSVFALTEAEENFFAQNNNLFYEPCATNESTGDGTIKISGNTAEEKVWSGLTSFLSEDQAAGAMGNIGGEENTTYSPTVREYGQTGDIYSRGVQMGYGLIQWSWGRRVDMLEYVKSKDSSLMKYLEDVEYALSGDDFIAKVGHEIANKIYMYEIEFLKQELDTKSAYHGYYDVTGVEECTVWWRKNIEVPGIYSDTNRINKANEVYKKYAGKTIVGDGVNSAGSGVSSSTLTSSVHDKAWELANQTREQAMQGPTAEYTAALKSVGMPTSSDSCANTGQSCDRFVTTVLRASGVDTEAPWGAVPALAEYFDSHPEIYEVVEGDPSDPNTYQPGDIIVRSDKEHIMIYGEKDGKSYILDASHCGRWAGYKDFEAVDAYKIYRTAGQATCEGQGNSNIAQTAIDLAWPKGTSSSKWKYPGGSSTDDYKKAAKKVKVPYKGINGTDCGYFVKTVVRYSGVDEKFKGAEGAKKNSDVWEIITWPKSDWKKHKMIQSGDIVRCYRSGGGGHWYIAAEIDGKIKRIGASRGGSYGRDEGKFYSASGCYKQIIIRAKNGSTTTSTTTNTTSNESDLEEEASAETIHSLAKEYAWEYETKESIITTKPTDEFKKAINSIKEQSKKELKEHGKNSAVFVRTVLIKSGILKADDLVAGVEETRKEISSNENFEKVNIAQGEQDENYEIGDIVFLFKQGTDTAKRVSIYARVNGDGYFAQATSKYYGTIVDLDISDYDHVEVYRYKEAETKSNTCDECAEETDDGTGLKEGGMTLGEATTFMEAYKKEADLKKTGSYSFQGAYIWDAGCGDGTLNNCVAFSQWFFNKYTTKGPKWSNTTNGYGMVNQLSSQFSLDKGNEPRPYSIFSWNSSNNHTGVILGVEGDKVVVGEASCGNVCGGHRCYAPRAIEYSISEMKAKGATYVYLESILNMNGA